MIVENPQVEPPLNATPLVDRLRRGDAFAWQLLSNMLWQRLRNAAAAGLPANVGGRLGGSDIVQQTLTEAHQAIAEFHGTTFDELLAWILAIQNRNVIDAVRHHVGAIGRTVRAETHFDDSSSGAAWDGVLTADQTSPSMVAARREAHDELLLALDNLPPRQRDAVRMRHLEGRLLAEIAAHLECTPQAAAAVIARGLRALREALKDAE